MRARLRHALELAGVTTYDTNNPAEFAIDCPKCKDTKHHLRVNTEVWSQGIQGWCNCYRRGCVLPVDSLIRRFKLKLPKTEDMPREITGHSMFLEAVRSLDRFAPKEVIVEPKHELVKLPYSDFPRLDANTGGYLAGMARRYLAKRGFSASQLCGYDVRYAVSGIDAGRIIIPFYEDEKLVYYQARSFMMSPKLKILNPEQEDGKSKFLFNLDQAREYSQVILTEGWASAMTAGPNAVAQSGIKPSERQLDLLLKYWDDYIIMLDAGTASESWWVARELKSRKPNSKVVVVDLPKGDPNDYEFSELQEFIKEASAVDWGSEIIARLK